MRSVSPAVIVSSYRRDPIKDRIMGGITSGVGMEPRDRGGQRRVSDVSSRCSVAVSKAAPLLPDYIASSILIGVSHITYDASGGRFHYHLRTLISGGTVYIRLMASIGCGSVWSGGKPVGGGVIKGLAGIRRRCEVFLHRGCLKGVSIGCCSSSSSGFPFVDV